MSAKFRLEAIQPGFGCIVHDLYIEAIDDDGWMDLYATWLEYGFLIFPGSNLSAEQQVALAGRFGPMVRERFPISNIKEDGSLPRLPEDLMRIDMLRGNTHWHCDNTFRQVQFKGTLYAAEIVTDEGGETGFADMRPAYDCLDEAQKAQLENLTACHSIRHGQESCGYTLLEDANFSPEEWPGPRRPLVKIHPETGRKSLLIGRHAHSVSGMTAEQSRGFLDGLIEFACQPPRVYFHSWRPGDAVLWDNRCLLHRGLPWEITKAPRRLWHTPIAGDPVTEAALAD